MKPIATGLALSCLMLLSACSGKARYIQTTDYLVCGNVRSLAVTETHPSRTTVTRNGDRYDIKLTTQNRRMAEIRAEVDSCEEQARKLSQEATP